MDADTLYSLKAEDLPRAALVMKDAFSRDPVWNAMFQDEPASERKLPHFFELPLRYCLAYGEVQAPSGALEGVCASVPGHLSEFTTWRVLRSGAIIPAMSLGMRFSMRMKRIFDPIQRDRRGIMGGRDFIYVLMLGVAEAHQGKGHGGRLLGALFGRADRQGLPVYLETETENNVSLYEHLGFRVMRKVTLSQLDLPMWEMLREPVA